MYKVEMRNMRLIQDQEFKRFEVLLDLKDKSYLSPNYRLPQ